MKLGRNLSFVRPTEETPGKGGPALARWLERPLGLENSSEMWRSPLVAQLCDVAVQPVPFLALAIIQVTEVDQYDEALAAR